MTDNDANFQSKVTKVEQKRAQGNLQHDLVIILVSGGNGSRAGGQVAKQYQSILGKPLIRLTLDALSGAFPHVPILPVIASGAESQMAAAAEGFTGYLLPPITGGKDRQQSVRNALEALSGQTLGIKQPEYIMIHDAARPFIPKSVAAALVAALTADAVAVLPALPVADTLKKSIDGINVDETIDRQSLFYAQTPQGFVYKTLLKAHRHSSGLVTDDCQLMEKQGHRVQIVAGDPACFKVTVPSDFKKVQDKLLLDKSDIRVGIGYDVHKFGPGDYITLGGIRIPHDKGLIGHSDADVLLHALTDALLGSISAGDIGQHFPPSDSKFKNADSAIFLDQARKLIMAKDGIIAHISAVIIAEEPKMATYKNDMAARIADILHIHVNRVSLQATTTEKLGFTGRSEGLAVQATATVRLPSREEYS